MRAASRPRSHITHPFPRVLLLFSSNRYPEIYEVGASNLGHVVLYTIINNTEGLLCDRSYLPGDDMVALLESKNRKLFAVESKRPLAHFDALGLSLAYELGAVNILEMLHLSGVPLSWKERDDKPDEPWDVDTGSWPLVFIGESPVVLLCLGGLSRWRMIIILFLDRHSLPQDGAPRTKYHALRRASLKSEPSSGGTLAVRDKT